MRRLAWFLAGFALTWVLSFSLASAQCPGLTTQLMPYAEEVLTISSTPKPFTSSVYKTGNASPAMAVMTLEGGGIRYFLVGTPTATDGHPVPLLQPVPICGVSSIQAFKAVRQDVDAKLTVTYFKLKTP